MPANETNSNEQASYPELDVQKLHALPSEQQDLYLLTFTSDLTRHVATLDADGASANQVYVRKELFKVINLTSPSTTRVIRSNLGLCFAGIFGKGDRKLLFEAVNELLAIVNSGKPDKDFKTRFTAVYCTGAIFEAAGDSAISLSTLACTSLLRLLKPSQTHAGFRTSLFKALGKIIKGIGKSADEGVVREIWRQARSAANGDKSYLVQASACWCTAQLLLSTPFIDNSNDFEKLQSTLWRVMDSPSAMVRRAAAACLGTVLVKSYSAEPHPVAAVKKQKKGKKRISDEDGLDDSPIERPGSPAPSKPITSLSFSLPEILKLLSSQYCRVTTSNRVRGGIALCYSHIFKGLDDGVIENQYSAVVRHFLHDLLGSSTILNNRYRLLITRKFARINLGEIIGRRLLGETGQQNAAKFLVNSILKDYPQSDVKERPEPSREALVMALDLVASFIGCLGSAIATISDLCRDALLQVLPHPSHTVQIHASNCLQALVLACPHQLLPSVTICMNSVNREVGQLNGPRRSPRKCLGFAYGLAAAISTSSAQPLFGSVEVYSRVLSQATSILKSSSSSDLRISSMQIQVAWILIGGLMSLGPNFIKIHLSQLLMLWKNALPKPLSKDNIGNRGLLELSFLAHVRECALGSISAFLAFNGRLLTVDVTKRLATMLQNTTMFLSSLPAKKTIDDVDKHLVPSLQLYDYELMVRRRVFGCYRQLISLSPATHQDALLQSSILSMAASSFADADAATSSLSSSIAASTIASESIWEVGDNSAFGLTGLVSNLEIKTSSNPVTDDQLHWLVQRGVEADIDRIICTPTCGDLEHDSVQLYSNGNHTLPDPLATGVVNAAIWLFAISLPLQSPKVQEGILEQVSTLLTNARQNIGRYMAITVNVAAAILFTLRVASKETEYAPGDLKTPDVEKALQELLHIFIVHTDQSIRNLGAEALGRLCKSSGSEFTSREVNYLVELIVSNREPHIRAGCATALGCVHSELGGMAAGYHLKNIVGVLTSLASDPQPTVHFWALDALSKVADSAGLAFSPYLSSTLGMTAQLYVSEHHCEEISSVTSSNLEVDLPTHIVIARCVDSMIHVLGPDLQDQFKARNMILTLTYQFQMETLPLAVTESLKCLEHLSLYAPGHISFSPYIRQLHSKMSSENPDVRDTALAGLYNAMRRGAEEVVNVADVALGEQLWLTLHDLYGQGIIRQIIRDWVDQSGLQKLDEWVKRIQNVLTRVKPIKREVSATKTSRVNGGVDLQDEEVAGFNAASRTENGEPESDPDSSQELLRWQARYIAMDCLNEILARVAKDAATNEDSPATKTLRPCIADIVRIAFSASTAEVVEMRICGIQIIERVLQIFGRVPDPDFPEVTLLEQYQAQISSALTPAFAADSSPTLAAEAVNVCASFISTGIVTDVERMGRILRLLVAALEDFSKDSQSASIGDLKNLSSNAQIMVKLSIFSAWAELQIASQEHVYLDDVVRPHLMKLTPLWLASLREYARLKFEPDVSNAAAPGALAGGLDTVYAALSRETLLKFYQSSWLKFVDAIASLIDEDSAFVFDALDGRDESEGANGVSRNDNDISYRDEPVAFFFVLFGISFEALVSSSSNQSTTTQQRTLEILRATQKILNPSVAGLAIYQDAIFSEAMDLFDRLVLTETLEVQTVVVNIARNLCIGHPAARKTQEDPDNEEGLSDDIDQLFELTRILVLVISNLVPNVSEHVTIVRFRLAEESASLIVLALNALVDSAEVFPAVIRSDLHACIFHIFATILSTGACQESLVPQVLTIFRRFVTGVVRNPQFETVTQLRSALSRFLVVIQNAQRGDTETSIPCEKNTLLACTILLTSSARIWPSSDPVIGRFLDEVAEALGNRMTTRVAAGLSRSLLLLPANTSSGYRLTTESTIAAHILPRLIDFLTNPSEVEGTEETRPIIAQALVTFALTLPPRERHLSMSIVVPTLLRRATIEGQGVWVETSTNLLDLAGKEHDGFKAVVSQMNTEQRALVEEVIRSGGGGARGAGDKAKDRQENGQDKQPSIALKFDF